MRWLLSVCVFITLRGVGLAVDSTTIGSLTLSSTFESISFQAAYTNDDNGNNSVVVEYRVTGASVWRSAYPPYMDRRATVDAIANPYYQQARGSIVGVLPNTSYDVQITWSDADGLTGSNPVTGAISTLTTIPPTGGSTLTVNNNTELATALSTVNPGQTIHLNSGTYAPFTITRSGNSGAWIVLTGETDGSSIVSGAGVTQNILVSADYIILEYLTLSASAASGVITNTGQHHIFVRHVTMNDIGADCLADIPGHYFDAGVQINSTDTYVLLNTITSTSLAGCVDAPTYPSIGFGVQHGNKSNLVIADNTFTGGFRDGIGGGGAGTGITNVDIARNTLTLFRDDGIELDGDTLNTRIWGNRVTVSHGFSGIAQAPSLYGPAYIFRNVIRVTKNSDAAFVFKLTSTPDLPIYVFHNSVSNESSIAWTLIPAQRTTVYNNIFVNRGNFYAGAYTNTLADYNVYQRVDTGYPYIYNWNGTTSYDTLNDFQVGTGQEAHGIEGNPLYLDTALTITTTSPAYNAGVPLANFNSADSAWPMIGGVPDIGAYEFGASATALPVMNLRLVK